MICLTKSRTRRGALEPVNTQLPDMPLDIYAQLVRDPRIDPRTLLASGCESGSAVAKVSLLLNDARVASLLDQDYVQSRLYACFDGDPTTRAGVIDVLLHDHRTDLAAHNNWLLRSVRRY